MKDEDYDDETEILDCPKCGREYDEIDADFLICHYCGWDAEEKYRTSYSIRMNRKTVFRWFKELLLKLFQS